MRLQSMTKPKFKLGTIPGRVRYYLKPKPGSHCDPSIGGHFACPYNGCGKVFCSACWTAGDCIGEQKCPHCGGAISLSTSADLEA